MAHTAALTPIKLWPDVEKVCASSPLVHRITNHGLMNLNDNLLLAAGADGLALAGAICGAKDPVFAAHELRTLWENRA